MPNVLGVLETVLYVDAFERACPFYEAVLGLKTIYRDARLCAYDVGGIVPPGNCTGVSEWPRRNNNSTPRPPTS